MELNDKVTQLEDEIKILKNEVQAVLLDLRESYLNRESPFNTDVSPKASQPIIINQLPPAAVEQPPIVEEEPDDITPVETQGSEPGRENHESELVRLEEPTNEPANESESVCKPELSASEKTAHEEVKRAWRPEIETAAHFKSKEATDSADGKLDLTTLANLAQWVDKAVKQLGQERTEAILDISETMGHMNPELKNILVKFISPIPDGHSGKVTTRDYLASLIELDSLLGKDNKAEAALLYILCQENDNR